MKNIIILENDYLLYLCAEEKKSTYSIYDLQRLQSDDRKLYERTENDLKVDTDVIKELFAKLKDSSECRIKDPNIILPHALSWYHYLEVEDYPKNQNEAVEFIMWKIQKIMPIPKDNAAIRIQVLRREKNINKLLVVATFKWFVKSLENALVANGLQPDMIITPTLAFMNVFEKSLPKNGIVFWLREKDFSQILFRDYLPIFIREVDRPLELVRAEFEVMSIISNVRERYSDYEATEILYFDELDRSDIESYFTDNVKKLSVKDRLINRSEVVNAGPYICGLGVLK